MWFVGVEVEQETSAPPPKQKSRIRPLDWLGYVDKSRAVSA